MVRVRPWLADRYGPLPLSHFVRRRAGRLRIGLRSGVDPSTPARSRPLTAPHRRRSWLPPWPMPARAQVLVREGKVVAGAGGSGGRQSPGRRWGPQRWEPHPACRAARGPVTNIALFRPTCFAGRADRPRSKPCTPICPAWPRRRSGCSPVGANPNGVIGAFRPDRTEAPGFAVLDGQPRAPIYGETISGFPGLSRHGAGPRMGSSRGPPRPKDRTIRGTEPEQNAHLRAHGFAQYLLRERRSR